MKDRLSWWSLDCWMWSMPGYHLVVCWLFVSSWLLWRVGHVTCHYCWAIAAIFSSQWSNLIPSHCFVLLQASHCISMWSHWRLQSQSTPWYGLYCKLQLSALQITKSSCCNVGVAIAIKLQLQSLKNQDTTDSNSGTTYLPATPRTPSLIIPYRGKNYAECFLHLL